MGELEQLLAKMAEKGAGKVIIKQVIAGTATEITATTCTVEREGSPALYGVRLNAIDDDLQSYFTVYPADKSNVLVAIIENQKTEAVLVSCSEIERVKIKIGDQTLLMDKDGFVFNGGNNAGMIIKSKLISEISKLNTDIQTLKTSLSAAFSLINTVIPGVSLPFETATSGLQYADLTNVDNSKIKH